IVSNHVLKLPSAALTMLVPRAVICICRSRRSSWFGRKRTPAGSFQAARERMHRLARASQQAGQIRNRQNERRTVDRGQCSPLRDIQADLLADRSARRAKTSGGAVDLLGEAPEVVLPGVW